MTTIYPDILVVNISLKYAFRKLALFSTATILFDFDSSLAKAHILNVLNHRLGALIKSMMVKARKQRNNGTHCEAVYAYLSSNNNVADS